MRILNFVDKIEDLSFEELQQTLKTEDAGGKLSKILPAERHQVISEVCEIFDKNGISLEVGNIKAQGGKFAKKVPYIEKQIGVDNVLESYWLQKLSTDLILPSTEDDEGTRSMIKFEYHDRGMTLSYGKNVLVCSNGMVAFRGDVMSTYGNGKMDYSNIKEVLGAWAKTHEEKSSKYISLINQMKEISVNPNEIINMIGKLEMQAVKQAYVSNETLAPFTISQVSAFTKGILNNQKEEQKNESLWDLYNMGTEIQKPEHMEIADISRNNFAFTNFVQQEYKLIQA